MKNWKYINGAEGVKIGNYGVSLDSAGARQVMEMAAKLWTSGMHNSRDIAMAIAFELAKTSKAMQENKADVVSNIQDMVDGWIKEVKTGNDTPAEYAKRPPKIVGGNSLPEELEKDVEKKDKEKVDDIEELKKTGNAKDKNDRDMKIGDIVDAHGKKGKIQKIITAKDRRDDVIEVFFDNSGTYNPDRTDRFYANEVVKVGNSAADDKFAYVMREFEEGKLKTTDGKVVTDPAQAKAIAYSESKKTENGLARARNAMAKNKKVKNSAVREYKHTDGRWAQIDFNEDGSDADMSIYDGSKEIEQKNFSTIRDAEQYVTSHGFRRI